MKIRRRGDFSLNARQAGALLCLGLGLALYGGVRAAATRPGLEFGPLESVGKAPRLMSGATMPVTVQRPTGRATINVVFPAAFKTPPVVTLTVVGGGETPVNARLTGPATLNGFQGEVSAPYFINRQETATVSVNWIAVGE
ncbi:MAG: hypothetical protein KY468_14220 [Armatimonadetes bacterium]|nr:hypothetical protein [Armatimonadota bacterium]